MGNRLNVSHGAPQNQASFIVDRGWKSSNSSPLPVEGEVFFLTFPFIDQGDFTQPRITGGIAMKLRATMEPRWSLGLSLWLIHALSGSLRLDSFVLSLQSGVLGFCA